MCAGGTPELPRKKRVLRHPPSIHDGSWKGARSVTFLAERCKGSCKEAFSLFLGMPASRWWILLFSRLWLNAGVRLAYPFLPTIARGLGVSMEQAGFLVAARSLVGLLSILFGFLTEKKGEKLGLLLGLFFLAIGGLCIGSRAGYTWVLIGFIFTGLAHAAYNPSVQSYVSAHVPYTLRARALGLLESSWSASWFVGMPLGGFLIAHYGWHVPYVAVGVIGIFLLLLTMRVPAAPQNPPEVFPSSRALCAAQKSVPSRNITPAALEASCPAQKHRPIRGSADIGPAPLAGDTSAHPEKWPLSDQLLASQDSTAFETSAAVSHPRLWPALVVTFFALLANESLMIVYGAWVEFRFSLGIGSLGLLSTVIGVMELAAELSVALVVDRLGKKRALAVGLLGASACYAALFIAQSSLVLSMAVFGGIAFFFEFTVVSSFPYMSEIDPNARKRWLSANYSLMVAGRVVGALVGPWLWEHTHTLQGHISLSFLATMVALVFLRLAPNPDSCPRKESIRP